MEKADGWLGRFLGPSAVRKLDEGDGCIDNLDVLFILLVDLLRLITSTYI